MAKASVRRTTSRKKTTVRIKKKGNGKKRCPSCGKFM